SPDWESLQERDHGRTSNRTEPSLSSQAKTAQTESTVGNRKGRAREGQHPPQDPYPQSLVDSAGDHQVVRRAGKALSPCRFSAASCFFQAYLPVYLRSLVVNRSLLRSLYSL